MTLTASGKEGFRLPFISCIFRVNLSVMKKAIFISIFFIIICITTLIVIKAERTTRYDLHSAKINGTMDMYYSYRNRTLIIVRDVKYKIIATLVSDNEFSIDDIARVGDTVSKAADNDTLVVTRKGDSIYHFRYTIKNW